MAFYAINVLMTKHEKRIWLDYLAWDEKKICSIFQIPTMSRIFSSKSVRFHDLLGTEVRIQSSM